MVYCCKEHFMKGITYEKIFITFVGGSYDALVDGTTLLL